MKTKQRLPVSIWPPTVSPIRKTSATDERPCRPSTAARRMVTSTSIKSKKDRASTRIGTVKLKKFSLDVLSPPWKKSVVSKRVSMKNITVETMQESGDCNLEMESEDGENQVEKIQ